MDLLCVIAMVSVLLKPERCQKPFKLWYVANGLWASFSMVFLCWFSKTQLAQGYQTKKAIIMTYVLEGGYILLSVVAWCMLTSPDPNEECQTQASSLIELMVDMIILLYMRSLRLMSILVFLIICGLPILYCYLKHRPRPTQDPAKLNASLNIVTLGTLHQLRNLNYRHKTMSSGNKKSADNSELLNGGPTPTLRQEQPNEEFQSYGMDMTCCICMENFGQEVDSELGNPFSEVEVVILPCKAHYFHQQCIATWMEKQNACPVCRVEITVDSLKKQRKELDKLRKAIEKEQSKHDSAKSGEDTSSLLINS